MALKHKLLGKNRKLVKTLEIDGEKVDIRKPTMGDKLDTLESARTANEVDEKNQPTSPRAGLRMAARIAACVIFDPATGQRVFGEGDLDDLINEGWLDDHLDELKEVFQPSGETVRGNSSATQS